MGTRVTQPVSGLWHKSLQVCRAASCSPFMLLAVSTNARIWLQTISGISSAVNRQAQCCQLTGRYYLCGPSHSVSCCREAVAAGKKPYFPKRSELKRQQLVAKFQRLKETGALEKYMLKRRRKTAAKDHKLVPEGRR